jgi:DNA-binding PadR family transcriptional regulator
VTRHPFSTTVIGAMPQPSADPASLLPLSEPVFQIMLAVAGPPRHGYAIMREVEERTDGRVRLGPGTLYGAIKRLRDQGVLEEVEDQAEGAADERRRLYGLTPFGREVARREAERLDETLQAARRKDLLPNMGAA